MENLSDDDLEKKFLVMSLVVNELDNDSNDKSNE